MITFRKYNEEKKFEEVWYDSSMIAYSKMVEDEYENKGDLTIVFKTGASYIYKGVSFEDYMVFIGGGTDASQGKTLNKIIKGKYEFEKSNDVSLLELDEHKNALILEEKQKEYDINSTYFISGHRTITDEEFEFNYGERLTDIVEETPDAKFVIGDCDGVDIMAQNYLIETLQVNPESITVYHMFNSPRNINPKITNTVGGFATDDERDEAMTKNSIDDIAFVRDINKISGTAKNILRRHRLNTFSF